jgi:predicted MFS family arabinose efflux permease
MNKRVIAFLMVAVMLFTFCTAPPAKAAAFLPLLGWMFWSIVAGATGVTVVADQTRNDDEQAQANNQRQEEPKGIDDTALASQQSSD